MANYIVTHDCEIPNSDKAELVGANALPRMFRSSLTLMSPDGRAIGVNPDLLIENLDFPLFKKGERVTIIIWQGPVDGKI